MTPQVLPEDDGPAGPWTPELAERLGRRATEPATATDPGLLERAERRTLGPAGTTDPRAALIRTDPGRHAANRGPAYGTPAQGGPVLPEGWTTMNLGPGNGWQPPAGTRIPAALIHRCPEPPESHEGWWASVGLAAGFLLASLAWWVVLTW